MNFGIGNRPLHANERGIAETLCGTLRRVEARAHAIPPGRCWQRFHCHLLILVPATVDHRKITAVNRFFERDSLELQCPLGGLEQELSLLLANLTDHTKRFLDAPTDFLHGLLNRGFSRPGSACLVSCFFQRTDHFPRMGAERDALRVVIPAHELQAGQFRPLGVGAVLDQHRQQLQPVGLLVLREQHWQLFIMRKVAYLEILRRE